MAYHLADIRISEAQHIYYLLGAAGLICTGLGWIGRQIWNVSQKVTTGVNTLKTLQLDVYTIKTNHLPHLYDRLGRIEGAIFHDRRIAPSDTGGSYANKSEGGPDSDQ